MLTVRSDPPAAARVRLRGGAMVDVVPATTAVHHAAAVAVERTLAALRRGEEAAATAGLDGPAILADDDLASGLAHHLLAVELGVRCITGWSGVGDEDGEPVAPGRDAILALCREPAMARAILDAALAPLHGRRDEGNASAASPSGAGGAAEATAEAAGTPESPAP